MHRLWVENWALPLEAWCDGARRRPDRSLPGARLALPLRDAGSRAPAGPHALARHGHAGDVPPRGARLPRHPELRPGPGRPGAARPLSTCGRSHSIANQLGKERVLDECWGAGGHDSTPADWSRIGRWLIVHGVNLLNPHLSLLTIRGTRKVDHPQTFSDHSAWFEHLRRSTTSSAGSAGSATRAGSSSGYSSSTP